VKAAAWLIGLAGTVLIVGLGGYKLMAALAKGRTNVGFLIFMGITALVVLWRACKPPRLSRRGQDYLQRLQGAFQSLKAQATDIAATSEPNPTAMLLVALFGLDVLAGTSYAYFRDMFAQAASSGGWSGGCGGGGCGGGGCGGGCGGCGG
jgi:uncharacterized protein (TIGR04222 family)